ncbi:MAG: DUF5788 family protein [Methanothrix sp.]|nr:DUF5788 family protein [Methanothrix sp.]
MTESEKNDTQISIVTGDYLTEEERKKMLSSLHRVLVWVGVKEPEGIEIDRLALMGEMEKFHQTEKDLPPEIHADRGAIDLHHLIWRLINEKEITDQEKLQIEEIIDLLGKKEKMDEDLLREMQLSKKQAKVLYNEAAGVIRALIDLKDLLKKKEHSDETRGMIQRKVEDTKRWNKFMDSVEKGDAL